MTDIDEKDAITIDNFLARLATSKQQLDVLYAKITDEEFVASSTPTDWSPKDHMAHLQAWLNGIMALIKRQSRAEGMGVTEEQLNTLELDELNHVIYELHKNDTAGDVRTLFEKTHHEFVATIQTLGDADLIKKYGDFLPEGVEDEDHQSPIIWYLVGNSNGHYDEHILWIETWLDGVRQAK